MWITGLARRALRFSPSEVVPITARVQVVAHREMSHRPSRNQRAPPPIPGGQYCLDCGRLLPTENAPSTTPRKFCSASCKTRGKSPGRAALYLHLAKAFHTIMLRDRSAVCGEVEKIAFNPPDSSDEGAGGPLQNVPEVKEADRREETRRSARRIVNFGWVSQGVPEERAVEAVQDGTVVEGSYAKGEWGIRWR